MAKFSQTRYSANRFRCLHLFSQQCQWLDQLECGIIGGITKESEYKFFKNAAFFHASRSALQANYCKR